MVYLLSVEYNLLVYRPILPIWKLVLMLLFST
nr:MAG TPA: hypothetical protein [Caudoviricetes sp.]